MTIKKLFFFGAAIVCFFTGSRVFAATSVANFDPATGILSVTGSCSGRYVLVAIRNSASGAVWGSSNPACVAGSYRYRIVIPEDLRTGGAFTVSAADNGAGGTGAGPATPVTFSPPPAAPQQQVIASGSISLSLDTSSLDANGSDVSFLDGALQSLFGIVGSAVNAVESSVVAAVRLFAKVFTILPGGSLTVPNGANQISGSGRLATGDTEVFIPNTAVASTSDIIITPTTPSQMPLAVTQIVPGSGFDVGVLSPQTIPTSFNWLIVGTYAVGSSTPTGAGQSGGGGGASPFLAVPLSVATSGDTSSPDLGATGVSSSVSTGGGFGTLPIAPPVASTSGDAVSLGNTSSSSSSVVEVPILIASSSDLSDTTPAIAPPADSPTSAGSSTVTVAQPPASASTTAGSASGGAIVSDTTSSSSAQASVVAPSAATSSPDTASAPVPPSPSVSASSSAPESSGKNATGTVQ